MPKYADILLPVAVPRPFTYAIPVDWGKEAVRIGMLVRVPLGKRKVCEGIVWRVYDEAPATKSAPKEIVEVVGKHPCVTAEQMKLWEWMADYYMCTLGEVMKASLPGEIRHGEFRPQTELYVRITDKYHTSEQTAELLEQIRRAKVQCSALLAYLALIPADEEGEPDLGLRNRDLLWVKRAAITEIIPAGAILKLIERGILEQREMVPPKRTTPVRPVFALQKQDPLKNIPQQTLLVEGELWSGEKTSVPLYPDQARRMANAGQQLLLLLPDTVTNAALINAMQDEFGSRCAVYHSRMTDHARSGIYQRMIEYPESVDVVIGTRAALFLPYTNLGIIVVDNEHDGNYKQNDPAPRYNGRDVAVVLGQLHGAKTVLASATPSVESWYNAENGKYGSFIVSDPQYRAPDVKILERGKGLISKYLFRRIEETLGEGKQVVLFQNRRGFAPYVECGSCGHTPLCPNCNVTLTYHKDTSVLQCHYCGWMTRYSSSCTACGMQTVNPRGIGTERIEEEVVELFPDTKVARIDTDIARAGMGAVGRIMTDFAAGETGILVGTQMVARTAQMGDIGLVGVINADNMLSYPDFRAGERAFQLLMQLKGLLAGNGQGEIVIQSSQRLHRVLIAVEQHDIAGFYAHELEEREGLLYPPFVRMIRLSFRHGERQLVTRAASEIHLKLQERFGRRVSPPFEPQVDRVQNQFILHIILRVERTQSLTVAKTMLGEAVGQIRKKFSTVHLTVEVDPQ